MTTQIWKYGMLGVFAMTLAGCNATGGGAPPPVASVPSAAAPASTPSEIDPSMLGGVFDTSVGMGMEDSDRRAAYTAQVAALESGQRRSWRGEHGIFGYVEAGAAQGSCRSFKQTVFIAGRPYDGHGQACRRPDGSWNMGGG